jgi:hypothetical protein
MSPFNPRAASRFLVICFEGDARVLSRVGARLRSWGHEVDESGSAEELSGALCRGASRWHPPDLVISSAAAARSADLERLARVYGLGGRIAWVLIWPLAKLRFRCTVRHLGVEVEIGCGLGLEDLLFSIRACAHLTSRALHAANTATGKGPTSGH